MSEAIKLAIPYSFNSNVHYSTRINQLDYDDYMAENNAVKLSFCGSRETSLIILGDTDAPKYTVSQLNRMKKQEILDELEKIGQSEWELSYNYVNTKKELVEFAASYTIARWYEEFAENNSWRDADDCLWALLGKHENAFITRGYSQGDAVMVVTVNNRKGEYDHLEDCKEYFSHLLWDCPIYIDATVTDNLTGEVIELDWYEFYELVDDLYDFDSDSFFENLKKSYLANEPYFEGLLIELESACSDIPYC